MRQLLATTAFLALAIPLAWADEKDDAVKKLNGEYEVVSVIFKGKPDAKKKDEVKAFTIKDGEIVIKEEKNEDTARFKLDPSKKPGHIDITPKNAKDVIKGIYETKDTDKGLELTVSFTMKEDAERPKDFKGEGEGTIVVKLLRKKEK